MSLERLSIDIKETIMIQASLMLILGAVTSSAKNFEKCTVKLDMMLSQEYGYCETPSIETEIPCEDIKICQKHFRIVSFQIKPYSPELVADLINTCCGACAKSNITKNIVNISEITRNLMNDSDFVFPVLGRENAKSLYGYRFLPIMETPSIYYVVPKQRKNIMMEVLKSCKNFLPLLVICLLMTSLSGFFCWVMETWTNEEEFPRHFLIGWFEGIWWSFISMTTVGYGDKTPKSIPGRLFSIIWIIMGITTFSFVTAVLSSEIHNVSFKDTSEMHGYKVGVLRGHLYDAMLIAKHGGILVPVDSQNITTGVKTLVNKLRAGSIDGFVTDKYEMILLFQTFGNDPYFKPQVDYLKEETILTEMERIQELNYGILVKDNKDYEFFYEFLTSNRDIINSCSTMFVNNYSRNVSVLHKRESIFSINGDIFWPSFVSCSLSIAVVLICGTVYELKKKYIRQKDADSVESVAISYDFAK